MTGWTQPHTAARNTESVPCEEAWERAERLRQADDHAEAVRRAVEAEIIPRLMRMHQISTERTGRGDQPSALMRIEADEVATFTELILQGSEPALARLKLLVSRGLNLETLCLDLLAPSARLLGEFWSDDRVDFTVVTIALGRMQTLLRSLSSSMRLPRQTDCAGLNVVFAPVPGEQHSLGITMVCDFFRTAGWNVWGDAPTSADTLIEMVQRERFDLVGFAISTDRNIPRLADLIRTVRSTSLNPGLKVLVGGPLLVERPQIAVLVGADATAPDARQAMLTAEKLIAQRDGGS